MKEMSKKILCTGGSGFLGSHLVDFLIEQDHNVFNYDIREGHDLMDIQHLKDTFQRFKPEIIYHTAGQVYREPGEINPYNDVRVNIEGMLNLLPLIDEYHCKMLYTSTGAVYGSSHLPHREDLPCNPLCNYGISKLAAEHYLKKWVSIKNVDAKIVRFSSIYGPRRQVGPVNIFTKQALSGGPITVYGSGEQTRDFVHVKDVLEGMELVLEYGWRGEIYNLGTGLEISVKRLALMIQSEFEDIEIKYVPYSFPPDDLLRSWFDISKARGLGYSPKIDLKQGIRELMLN